MKKLFNRNINKSLKSEIKEFCDELLNSTKLEEIETESLGINDGREIIEDFLSNNEHKLAFEHLKYVITELELDLNSKQKQKMISLSNKFSK